MAVAQLCCMSMDLKVLKSGQCEPLKLGIHGLSLGLAALCGLYNAAAWLSRRENHLALKLYVGLIAIEQRHVAHHIAACRCEARPDVAVSVADGSPAHVPAEIAA